MDGVYVGGTAQLTIGPGSFSSSDNLVDTLVHEAFHVEQYKEGRWYESDEGWYLNEIEAYDHVLSLKDELELSDPVIKKDEEDRDTYYSFLPSSLKDRVDKKDYTLPK